MDIKTLITLKYNDLLKLCNNNIIHQIDNNKYFKEVEDKDLLNTMMIKFLKKYKHHQFIDEIDGFDVLKKEFLGERRYQYIIKDKIIINIDLIGGDIIDDNTIDE